MVDSTRNETLNYTYDELDRLKTADGPYSQNYNYNSIGNITDTGFQMTAISADSAHTCALTIGGGVKCWGSNSSGRLGDGTSIDRTAPVSVSGLATGVSAIAAGGAHTCALTTSGGLKCWGKNANGQLGDGTTTQRTTPVDVSGLTSGVSAVSGGGEHTCALTTGGGVKCWGDNLYGQLGDGTNIDRNTPVNVSGLTSGVSAIVSGQNHTCAVLTTGGLKCWGRNNYGQLGDNSTTDRNTPVNVSGLTSGVSAVSPGEFHTCALTTTGGLKCWGRNTQGQLGDGTTTQRNTPVDVSGLTSGVSAVSSGNDHTCTRTTSGGVKCWGDNIDGQLGDGTNTDRRTPVDVSGLTSGVSAISSGGEHACALTTSGGVKCWGGNLLGQLGNGTLVNTNLPVNTLFATLTTYTYGDTAHKHAVTSLATGESYSYDANGNMITRVEGGLTYTQTFDAENRLISVTVSGQTTQFIYDGDGNLVKKIKPDGSKTLYVGGIYEVDKTAGGSVTRTVTYYPAAGAMRIDSTLYYVLKDHLSSASVVTNASSTTVGEQRYYPFGETRLITGTIYTDRLFTSQREMAGLGIYHFGARFYSPKLGRFLSPDTIVPGYANPQNLNRFSYVTNNPLRYTDLTGHRQCEEYQGQCLSETQLTQIWQSQGGSGGGDGSDDSDGGDEGLTDPTPDLCSGEQDEFGHCYVTEHVVCPAEYECTREEMQYYATLFQYPGQNPWFPVQQGQTYFVFPAPQLAIYFGNPALNWTGAIQTFISPDGLTLTNQTLSTHIFHDGVVVRSYEQQEDGAWTVTTTGVGTNVWPVIGSAIDQVNDVVGPVAFTAVDAQMLAYITHDQILSGTFPRWIIH